ncbi:TPR-like protein [Xylaria nigripes]|nr:TPR-like protein [Xylaria nigripes]
MHLGDESRCMAEPGLYVIYDSDKDGPVHEVAEIDIVAVHGLNFKNSPDHARDTWTADDNGSLWLKDFLPGELTKRARVMLFSYNSSPVMGAAALKLDDHAKSLLRWLHTERQNEPRRPLIFICHGLGGLVVKEAIIEATLDPEYKAIAKATRLLVFFATPHRGGNYANTSDVVAKIARVGLLKPDNKLLDELKKNSHVATKRLEQSRHIYEQRLVVNFFEGEAFGKLGIIVDRDSATLNLPGSIETQVATHADHYSICKFSNADSPACQLVIRTIVDQIDRALRLGPKNVHWLVPRSANPMLIGRQGIVSRIKTAMISSNPGNAQKRFILTGMGGQGKSEVCLKVADELREDFWGVFWVDVSSEATAKAGFATIAKMLGSGETEIDDARRLLSNIDTDLRWLLVLDNADDPDVEYQQYYPSGTRGAVLLTSRNPRWQRYATVGGEDLGSLDKQGCIRLLLQPIGLASVSPEVESDAEKVVNILSSHTLTLLQAGAYIAQGACSLSEYPDVFRRHRERLLSFKLTSGQSRYHSLYATLEASVEFLTRRQDESSQDALCILQALSPLHYENVPLDVFQEAWNGAQMVQKENEDDAVDKLSKWHVSQLPDVLGPDNQTWDPFRMSEAVGLLESLALIKKRDMNGYWTVSMHPLARMWLNLRQTPSQREKSLRMCQCIIALSRYGQPSWRPYRDRMALHVLALLQQTSLTQETRQLLIPVCVQFGWLLCDLRYDQKLREHLENIFTELRIDRDNPEKTTLSLFRIRSRNAFYLDKAKSSIEILVQISKIEEAVGETHPSQLALQHELAVAHLADGQVKQAIHLLKRVVQIEELTTYDKTQALNRLASQHELATAYLADARTEQAIDLFKQIVQTCETTLEPTHPHRVATQHGLARAYLADGQTKQAINLFKQVVDVHKTTLYESHPDRFASLHGLASAYLADGQGTQAITLFKLIAETRRTAVGEEYLDHFTSQHEPASGYLAVRQTTRPIHLFK